MILLDDLLARNKSRRKILLALLGLVTAIVAAVGGGQAVQIALSYQDNSNTAKNGGVVTGDIQGAGVAINTGSGDIVQHKGQGDINIGISLEQYKADLKEREQEVAKRLQQTYAEGHRLLQSERQAVTEKLKQAHEARWTLETEKSEIERRLADTESSYQDYIKGLQQERIAELEAIRGQVPDALLDRSGPRGPGPWRPEPGGSAFCPHRGPDPKGHPGCRRGRLSVQSNRPGPDPLSASL